MSSFKMQGLSQIKGITRMYCSPVCSSYSGQSRDLINRKCTSPFLKNCRRGEFLNSSNQCESCPQNCYECNGTTCHSCSHNYYLKNNECLARSVPQNQTVIQILVMPGSYSAANPVQSSDGSITNPFHDLRDALVYANEKAAPFTTSQVIIHMARGLHFITLRSEGQAYLAQQQDLVSLDYDLIIKPLVCGDMGVYDITQCQERAYIRNTEVTIVNKIGSYFYFDVSHSLLLHDISFDGIDSVASWDEECLTKEQYTCKYEASTKQVTSLLNKQNGQDCCLKPTQSLDYCNFNDPTSLFRIKYTAANELRSPKMLRIQRVQFRNLFYSMNSLIQVAREGADISVFNSTFENVSSCGGIISNLFTLPKSDLLRRFGTHSDVNLEIVDNWFHNHEYESSKIDGGIYDPFMEQTPCHSASPDRDSCYSILLSGNSFRNFDIFFNENGVHQSLLTPYAQQRPAVKYANMVNKNRASIIQLQNYQGYLTVESCTFINIKLPSLPCFNHTIHSWTDTITLNRPYSLASQLTGLKTEMPIIITNSLGYIQFIHNNITASSGTKGFLKITLQPNFSRPVIIYRNKFEGIAGFFYSGVLNLQSTHTLESREVNQSSSMCGGFHVSHNSFLNNVVCPVPSQVTGHEFYGLVKVSCSLKNEAIFLQDQVNSVTYDFWKTQAQLTTTSQFFEYNITSGQTLDLRRYQSTLQRNEFNGNLIGEKSSVVLFQQVPFLISQRNTFTNTKDLILTTYQQNYTHPGFIKNGPITRSSSSFNSTGALLSILGGIGFEIIGQIIGSENWKYNLDQNVYASFLYVDRVRRSLILQDLRVSTPPINVCNQRALQASYNQLMAVCMGKNFFIADSNTQPFIRFKDFSDPLYRASELQTEIKLQNCTFQNFATNKPNVKALIDFNTDVSHKVLFSVNNTIFRNIVQREFSSILSLEEMSSRFTNIVFQDIGNSWFLEGPDNLFQFKLRDGSTGQDHFFTNISISNIFIHQFAFDLSDSFKDSRVDLQLDGITISDITVTKGIVKVDHDVSTLVMKNWVIRNVRLFAYMIRQNSFFQFNLIRDVDIENMNCECSYYDNNCMLIYAKGLSTNLTIVDSKFTQVGGPGWYFEHDERSPIQADFDKFSILNSIFENFQTIGYMGGVFNLKVEGNFIERGGIYRQNRDSRYGGVFYFRGISNCEFNDTVFEGNKATYGGAIFMIDETKLIMNRVRFDNNYAQEIGGGIYATHSSAFKIRDSTFY